MVGLQALARRARADSADRNRTADGKAEIVGEYRRCEPLRQRHIKHAFPRCAGFDHDAIGPDLVDCAERAHLDDDAFRERAAKGGMALPACRHLQPQLAGRSYQATNVRS